MKTNVPSDTPHTRPELLPSSAPQEIADALTRVRARLGLFAGGLIWYTEVGSTNDVAARLADAGCAEGTVVSADHQTAGRGRQGRVWVSPPGAGLYVSIVLRPTREAAALLSLTAGLAICEGVQAASGLEPHVKWPNDVYISSRKLAGVLAEAGTSAGGFQHVVLGCGINVLPASFPPEVAHRATSIESELGRPVDRGVVLAECLAALAARYADLRAGRSAGVLDAWRSRAALTFGRRVEWDAPGEVSSGRVEGVDDTGALLVRTAAGVARVVAGEVRWI